MSIAPPSSIAAQSRVKACFNAPYVSLTRTEGNYRSSTPVLRP